MTVRSETYRRAKYKGKLDADVIRDRFADQKSNMETQIDAVFPQLVTMENAVKAAIEDQGVTSIEIPFYLNFGREVWRIRRRFSGAVADAEIATMRAKWVARGLTSATLDLVAAAVP